MRVFLADLGHNQLTFSSDIYPIGAANIAAYTTAYLKSPTPVEVRLFREPEDLRAALDSSAPDVLALSSYAWNHELSKSLARYGKRRKHDLITMMGGPNYPLTLEEWRRSSRACRKSTWRSEDRRTKASGRSST